MSRARQGGVALLTALLVVALATLLLLGLAEQNALLQARTAYLLRAEQAYRYAQGLEGIARLALHDDWLDAPGISSRSDRWAQALPPLPVPGGRVWGRLEDLDGRFNLNSLIGPQGEVDALAVDRFERLLRRLGLDPAIAAQALDWIDADGETRRDGAEDLHYLQQSPPYRAANRPFVDVSELRLLRSVDDQAWQRLAPEVSAREPGAGINVNTASVAVLMALAENLSREQAERLHADGHARFGSVGDFVAELEGLGVVVDPRGLQVGSRWFQARAWVELDERVYEVHSLMLRDGAELRVLQRRLGRGEPST